MWNFQVLRLDNCTLEGKDVRDFADALVRSGCSKRMFSLSFCSLAPWMQMESAHWQSYSVTALCQH